MDEKYSDKANEVSSKESFVKAQKECNNFGYRNLNSQTG